jgi:hypothetical protein
MDRLNVKKISLEEHRRHGPVDEYWAGVTAEERLSAVEILRRQYGKLNPEQGYESSQRVRRVLRVVQRP